MGWFVFCKSLVAVPSGAILALACHSKQFPLMKQQFK